MKEKLTQKDVEKIQQEIDHRKLVVRKEAIEAVKEARAQGDLSENFEYHAAKKAKNQNESRIRYLERMLKTAEIVEVHSKADEIGLNNTVELYCEDDDEVETYRIGTSVRGSALNGLVSIESPIGKALLGHKEGDRVYIKVNDDFGYYVVIRKVIKTEEKVCNYIDMPIQHSENRILQRMGRRTSREDLVAVIKKLRKELPDITIRTTLITGFPGESQKDHEGLRGFVEECQFDRLGVFTYSPEEDTLAATFEDQIDEEVKEERRDELMSLQQEISYDKGTDRIGQELLVMIEGKVADESAYIGRTYGDAPKVDGYIFVQTGELLMTGDFAKVRVTGALEYDLIGELADEYTE